MSDLIGKKLEGRYQLLELVGVGGMANVYKAQDLKTEKIVAVKILREEFMDNEELVRRFKNESKAISILDHPNIVKVFDVSVNNNLQFIVMEYLDGITLKEYMNRRAQPLNWKETLHFIEQILIALEHAHSKGVVHRDIKPQNIMMLPDGTLKMMDFGIARFSRAEYQTVSDKAIGSVHYISPEQARGDVTDATADIYSVGIMLYEMLSGKLPFESDNAVSVAIKQIADKPKPLCEVSEGVPEALQDITERAMAKNPADRYPSARAMLDDIEEFKRDPSIRFEYEYLTDTEPERYFNKVVKQTKSSSQQPERAKAGRKPSGNKKKRRIAVLSILAGMAVAFAIGAVILCYMIFANSTNPLFSTAEDVELVNFVGMTREEIENNSEYRADFKFKFVEEYSDKPAGEVYSQNPKPPRAVKEGQLVTLKVSLGTRYVTIPDVTNYVLKDAEEMLQAQGLSVRVLPMQDDSVPVGTVIRTDPAANEQVAVGSGGKTVAVYVSRSEVNLDRTVPPLTGLTVEDTQKALRNANLVLGRVDEAFSDLEPGLVISQDPAEGSTLKMNSKVNVAVSKGPEPTPEPTPEPEEEEESESVPESVPESTPSEGSPEEGEGGSEESED